MRLTPARGVLLAALVATSSGCVRLPRGTYATIATKPDRAVATAAPVVSADNWALSRARLEAIREGLPSKPYAERVRVSVTEPRTGHRFEGRGAVAISPDRAARMMLVGPGGVTALDLWVTRERFRFSVPGLKLEKRGRTESDDARGLPVGMLRWWFLAPLSGRLLFARSTPRDSAWVLRDRDATVTVRTDSVRFFAIRREDGKLEGIEWVGRGLVPAAGARGVYIDGEVGLRVDVTVEAVMPSEPDPAAFIDPDEPEGTAL